MRSIADRAVDRLYRIAGLNGAAARLVGKPLSDNPYKPGDERRPWWRRGWQGAKAFVGAGAEELDTLSKLTGELKEEAEGLKADAGAAANRLNTLAGKFKKAAVRKRKGKKE